MSFRRFLKAPGAVNKPISPWEFIQQPIPLTILALILGLLGVKYYAPLLVVCEVVLIYDFYRYGISLGKKWSWIRYLVFILVTSTALGGADYLLTRSDQNSVIYRPPTEGEQLCPHPLAYSLRELAKPTDDNYSTELTIKNNNELMLTVDIYLRTLYSRAFLTYPTEQHEQVIGLELRTWDGSFLKLTATSGVSEYKLEIHTFQPLRVKCINQAN